MHLQCIAMSEGLCTKFTGVGLFSSMDSFMTFQRTNIEKTCLTMFASVGLFSCVDHLVILQCFIGTQFLPTKFTYEASSKMLMVMKGPKVLEWLITILAFIIAF